MNETDGLKRESRVRRRAGLVLTMAGFVLYVMGADPALLNMDRSPVTGILQILVFLIALAVMCLGGYISLASLWGGQEKTIAADIGLRLVATGYVIAVASGMADVFGFGTQMRPHLPYFGQWQEVGVMVGEAVIAFGFVLMLPFGKRTHRSKVESNQPE